MILATCVIAVAAGGALYTGIKAVEQREKGPFSLLDHLNYSSKRQGALARILAAQERGDSNQEKSKQIPIAELRIQLATYLQTITVALADFDNQYQAFVQAQLDPLLGAERNEQLLEMTASSGGLAISEYEKILNRALGFSLVLTGLAAIASIYFQPLILVCLPITLYLSLPILNSAYHSLVYERRIKLDLLGSINLLSVWLGGYFTIGGLSLMLYYLGEKLIRITQDRAHKQLVNIFGQQPHSVWILVNGVEVEIPFENLQMGDTLVVSAGQLIPVDGTVVQGYATIDQHRLTGESQPVQKGSGDQVLAATMVLTGKLQIGVEKTGKETVAAQIGEILSNTSGYQMALESKGAQIANDSVLPTLVIAGFAGLVTGYSGGVSVTYAGFGYNVIITGPIAMLNYLNILAHHGILVKDGRSLELLNKIDTVVFDKTGTLTLDQPHVLTLHRFSKFSSDVILAYAAAAEQRQTHPIARAILTAAQERELNLPAIDDAHYEVGYGIKAMIDGKCIRVGSHRFMELEAIPLPSEIQELQAGRHAQGHSLVMVAVDAVLVGAIELEPTIRPEAREIIAELRRQKVSLYIISGDQEQPTRHLAQALGIEHYVANTLPSDKARIVEQLQQEGRSICFVGDGINDSIALKKANVSISLRGATTVATDTAQIILMDGSLQQLPTLFALAREFNLTMKAGFATAMIPGVLIVGGVFLFNLGLISAVILSNFGLLAGLGTAMSPLLMRAPLLNMQHGPGTDRQPQQLLPPADTLTTPSS